MAQIYISDETKEKLRKLAELEKRTQDGEIEYLLDQRLIELNENK
jgi:hypothetical protein